MGKYNGIPGAVSCQQTDRQKEIQTNATKSISPIEGLECAYHQTHQRNLPKLEGVMYMLIYYYRVQEKAISWLLLHYYYECFATHATYTTLLQLLCM